MLAHTPGHPSALQRLLMLEEAGAGPHPSPPLPLTFPSPSPSPSSSPFPSSLFSLPLSALIALPSFRFAIAPSPSQRRHPPSTPPAPTLPSRPSSLSTPPPSVQQPRYRLPTAHQPLLASDLRQAPRVADTRLPLLSASKAQPRVRLPQLSSTASAGSASPSSSPSARDSSPSSSSPSPSSAEWPPDSDGRRGSSSASAGFCFPPSAPPLLSASSAPLSLPALQALASDPSITSAECSTGTLVDRFHNGHHRRYILYSCIVCGKQSGDKSKHKKHERACKKKLIRQRVEAEKEEARRLRQLDLADRRRLRQIHSREAKQQQQQQQQQQQGAHTAKLPWETAATPTLARPASHHRKVRMVEEGQRLQLRALSKAELHQLMTRELRAIYHCADSAADSCLLSRDSVLARIDLSDIFQAPDIWSHFTAHDIHTLCTLLPERDRVTIQRAQQKQQQQEEDGDAPSPSARAVAPDERLASTDASTSRPLTVYSPAFALPTLSATVADPVFCRSLREYQQLLRTGSLDPALKGLRLMAEGKRRRQQRQQGEWKKRNFETYWGEALSDIKVNAQKPHTAAAARRDSHDPTQPLPPTQSAQSEGSKRGGARAIRPTSAKGGRRPPPGVVAQARGGGASRGQRRSHRLDDDSEATQSDSPTTDSNATGAEEEGGSSDVDSASAADSSSQLSDSSLRSSADSQQPRPLHNTFRRRRAMSWSSMEDGKEQEEGDEHEVNEQLQQTQLVVPISTPSPLSSPSPLPPAGGTPPQLVSLLPLPQPVRPVPVPLPASYPIIQRFHFRSPRFRTAKRATFVLRGPGEREATATISPHSAQATGAKMQSKKRKGNDGRPGPVSTPPPSSAALFSHLPPAVAQECAQLCSAVWSEEAKAAARQLITSTSSSRLKQVEQEKLDRAVQAEARLLMLMEEREEAPLRQQQRGRQGEVERTLRVPQSSRKNGSLIVRVKVKKAQGQVRAEPPTTRPGDRAEVGSGEHSEDGDGDTAEDEEGASTDHPSGTTSARGDVADTPFSSSFAPSSVSTSLRSSAASAASAVECASSAPSALSARPSPKGQADLRHHLFCPSPSDCQSAFSTFLLHVTQGPRVASQPTPHRTQWSSSSSSEVGHSDAHTGSHPAALGTRPCMFT